MGDVTASAAIAAPRSGASYDGKWSVEVITDRGTCDRVYRWTLGIQGGRVVDLGDIAKPSGGVSAKGGVAMRFVRSNDYASATGSSTGIGAAAAGPRRRLPAAAAGAPSAGLARASGVAW